MKKIQIQKKIINTFKIKNKIFIEKLIFDSILIHDKGKINPTYQCLKMKNRKFKEAYEQMEVKSLKHSFLDAVLFLRDLLRITDPQNLISTFGSGAIWEDYLIINSIKLY